MFRVQAQLFWRALGGLFFLTGAIGLFLPIWPTTIFWILAAGCFAKGAPELRDWIYRQPHYGALVRDFLEQGVLARRAKFTALIGLALSAGFSAWALWDRNAVFWAALSCLSVVAVYIATLPSQPRKTGS